MYMSQTFLEADGPQLSTLVHIFLDFISIVIGYGFEYRRKQFVPLHWQDRLAGFIAIRLNCYLCFTDLRLF